jgi:hypothetical protein
MFCIKARDHVFAMGGGGEGETRGEGRVEGGGVKGVGLRMCRVLCTSAVEYMYSTELFF